MLIQLQSLHLNLAFVVLGQIICCCSTARADLILSFSPSIDPNQAIVGRSFSVDVVLSGLVPGDRLTFLGFDATVNASNFSMPTNLRAGAIVRDNRSFSFSSFSFGSENFATASFESQLGPTPPFPLPPIESNGVFMSFDITPTRTGASPLNFVFVGSAGRNSLNVDLPNARGGPPLQFSVAAVPEADLCGLLLIAGGFLQFRRRSLSRL